MRFGFVPDPLGAGWPVARALLAGAVERGGNNWGEVESCLADGRAQLWLTVDDGPINATVTRRDGDTLEIWLCGGAVLSGALPYLETILSAAKQDGATKARITGRKGWDRVLHPYGWRRDGELLVKSL